MELINWTETITLRNDMEALALKVNGLRYSTSNPSFKAFEKIMEAAQQFSDAVDHFDKLLDRDIKEDETVFARKKLEQLVSESVKGNY